MLINNTNIMNKQKFFVLTILTIFCIGMTLGCATASHTYHKGGYTFTVSDKYYKNIQSAKKGDYSGDVSFKVKTNKYKTVKVPKYKNKKVTKYKWKYKTVTTCYDYYDGYGNLINYKNGKSISKDLKNGWKYYSSYTTNSKYGKDGKKVSYHCKLKKKVKYKTTKKVKSGYKKVKVPVYALGGVARGPAVKFYAIGHGVNQIANDGTYYYL